MRQNILIRPRKPAFCPCRGPEFYCQHSGQVSELINACVSSSRDLIPFSDLQVPCMHVRFPYRPTHIHIVNNNKSLKSVVILANSVSLPPLNHFLSLLLTDFVCSWTSCKQNRTYLVHFAHSVLRVSCGVLMSDLIFAVVKSYSVSQLPFAYLSSH